MIIYDANGQPYDADVVSGVAYRALRDALLEIAECGDCGQEETDLRLDQACSIARIAILRAEKENNP